MELIIIGNGKYCLLCININTRFKHTSKKIPSKTTSYVLQVIKILVETHEPVIIFCDNDGTFTSRETVEYLVNKKIELKVFTEHLHSSLGIINRACRTLKSLTQNFMK